METPTTIGSVSGQPGVCCNCKELYSKLPVVDGQILDKSPNNGSDCGAERRIARNLEGHIMSTVSQSWSVKPVQLRYTLGEKKLFSARFLMAELESHFTKLAEGAYENWSDWATVPGEVDGVLIRSQPTRSDLPRSSRVPGGLRYVPAQYERYFLEFKSTFEEYLNGFSPKHRKNWKREVRKFTEMSGGKLEFRAYRTPDEVAEFLSISRELSKKTFQERLLDAGLPSSAEYRSEQLELARQDRIRAYLLFHEGKAVSYLLTEIGEPGILIYRYLGYDPEYRASSPGSVLHYLALERLFAEGGLRLLDFTEGEGIHKRLMSTGSCHCADIYFFRNTPRIWALLQLHAGLRGLSAGVVKVLDHYGLKARVKKFIRARA